MTTLRRPRPFLRLSRADLTETVAALETQRDQAIGRARATLDYACAWLTSRADAYRHDAARQDRPRPGDVLLEAGSRGRMGT